MKIHDMTSRSWLRTMPLGFLLALSVLIVGTGSASANVTHKYLYSFPVTEESFRVSGVDGDGNVYLYDQTGGDNSISRYNPVTEKHVPFPALESNVIDGSGGTECPAVKQDCDRVPSSHLTPTYGDQAQPVVVSAAPGPTKGYIYAANSGAGAVEVFAPSGKYLERSTRPEAFLKITQIQATSRASRSMPTAMSTWATPARSTKMRLSTGIPPMMYSSDTARVGALPNRSRGELHLL